jgi:hypothetical protein
MKRVISLIESQHWKCGSDRAYQKVSCEQSCGRGRYQDVVVRLSAILAQGRIIRIIAMLSIESTMANTILQPTSV